MDLLLSGGVALAGLVAGAVLDPVGQHLADDSAARDADTARDDSAARDADTAPSERSSETIPPRFAAMPGAPLTAGVPAPAPAPSAGVGRPFLPVGPSRWRTIGAAAATGVLCGAVALRFGAQGATLPLCIAVTLLVALSVTDLTHRLVPRRLLYPGAAVMVAGFGGVAAANGSAHALGDAAIGGAVAFAVFFAVWWFVPRGMGFGDVRLAGVIGVATGWLGLLHAYLAFLVGFGTGLVFGLVSILALRTGRRSRIPFAPSLAVGAVMAILFGNPLVHLVFHQAP
ncbi:MAG: A24 family peptidase [Actinomycetota bacterium]|nr:A24 family peptidase [Actinomycetota bacterium]MDA8342960.1 A24 family peptidase [Actinomycetota bacterium]